MKWYWHPRFECIHQRPSELNVRATFKLANEKALFVGIY